MTPFLRVRRVPCLRTRKHGTQDRRGLDGHRADPFAGGLVHVASPGGAGKTCLRVRKQGTRQGRFRLAVTPSWARSGRACDRPRGAGSRGRRAGRCSGRTGRKASGPRRNRPDRLRGSKRARSGDGGRRPTGNNCRRRPARTTWRRPAAGDRDPGVFPRRRGWRNGPFERGNVDEVGRRLVRLSEVGQAARPWASRSGAHRPGRRCRGRPRPGRGRPRGRDLPRGAGARRDETSVELAVRRRRRSRSWAGMA